MAKHIRLVFRSSNVEAVAALLEDDAPVTCERVWKMLAEPIEGMARQERDMGAGLYVAVPPFRDLPAENATAFPAPGDLVFYAVPGLLPRCDKKCTIHVFYARGAKGLLRVGWTAGNVFATVTENLEGLQRVARATIETGPQPMRIERIGDR